MFCMECGAKLPDHAKFCMNCGTRVGEMSGAAAAAPAARSCTPGKKYQVFAIIDDEAKEKDEKTYGNFLHTEIGANDFYCGYYARLEDGTAVGWVYKHIAKYKNEFDHYYNLYRVDPDGTATFLGAGSRSGIEEMYVKDGYAYWCGFGVLPGQDSGWYRTNIYDTTPAERLEKAPD